MKHLHDSWRLIASCVDWQSSKEKKTVFVRVYGFFFHSIQVYKGIISKVFTAHIKSDIYDLMYFFNNVFNFIYFYPNSASSKTLGVTAHKEDFCMEIHLIINILEEKIATLEKGVMC